MRTLDPAALADGSREFEARVATKKKDLSYGWVFFLGGTQWSLSGLKLYQTVRFQ